MGMHRLPRLARAIQLSIARSPRYPSCATSSGSQPHVCVSSPAASPTAFSQTTQRGKPSPREETLTRPRPRDVPIAALGTPATDGTLGMRMAEWQTGRYAWMLDDKVRPMDIGDSLQFLRLEHASLMARYQRVRERQKRHVGFEEDLHAVEKVILCRREVLMSRIFELETCEDGLKCVAQAGVFRSMWDRARLVTKGRPIWDLFS